MDLVRKNNGPKVVGKSGEASKQGIIAPTGKPPAKPEVIDLPALPYLVQRIEGLKKRGEVSHYSLAYFGLPGARVLISLLEHENRAVRETAMDVLGIALRIDPRRRGDVKISESEYDQILELVRTKALPRMKELVEIESRQQNYRAAAMALVKIEKELTEGSLKK